jgi:hypothetical protein
MPRDRKAYAKKYREENLEMVRAKDRERYKKDKPKRIAGTLRWVKENPEKRLAIWLKYKYKMPIDSYNRLKAQQNNLCAICEQEMNPAIVDHDHQCCPTQKACGNCIRGLLCRTCNTNLGVYEVWMKQNVSKIEGYLNGKR